MKLFLCLLVLWSSYALAQSTVIPRPYTAPLVEEFDELEKSWIPVKTSWFGGSREDKPVRVLLSDDIQKVKISVTVNNREFSIVSLYTAAKTTTGEWIIVPFKGIKNVGPLSPQKKTFVFDPKVICSYVDCSKDQLDLYFFVRPWPIRVGRFYEFEPAFRGVFYRFYLE